MPPIHCCDVDISVLIHWQNGRDEHLTTRLQLYSLHAAKCKPSTCQLIQLMSRDYWRTVTLANHQNAHITSSSTKLVQSQQQFLMLLSRGQTPVLWILFRLHQKHNYAIHCLLGCDAVLCSYNLLTFRGILMSVFKVEEYVIQSREEKTIELTVVLGSFHRLDLSRNMMFCRQTLSRAAVKVYTVTHFLSLCWGRQYLPALTSVLFRIYKL